MVEGCAGSNDGCSVLGWLGGGAVRDRVMVVGNHGWWWWWCLWWCSGS